MNQKCEGVNPVDDKCDSICVVLMGFGMGFQLGMAAQGVCGGGGHDRNPWGEVDEPEPSSASSNNQKQAKS
uniref:Uncharacterized protein n=1 Tax=Fagus sylvatica TaxID=28930 RepID=A0A2N9GQN7_FAGSY